MSLEQLVTPRPGPVRPPDSCRDVVLLRWPAQEALRLRLAADDIPRLLLIARARLAPVCVDELEDWVREPLDPGELDARSATLRRRARGRALRPRVDGHGLVWAGDRWVDLPPAQLAVARVLIAHHGRVVAAEQIQRAYLGAGGSVHPKAVRAMISRIRSRLGELGLVLVNVRYQGYLLEAVESG